MLFHSFGVFVFQWTPFKCKTEWNFGSETPVSRWSHSLLSCFLRIAASLNPSAPGEAVWDLTLKLLKAEKSAEAVAILVFRGWRQQALAKSLWPGLCGAWMYSNYLGYSNQNWLVMGYWTTADCDFGSKGTAGFHWPLSLSFSFGNRILFLHKTGEFVLVFTSVATLLIATV